MYQSIDISLRLMSMNARTRVPTYSQQGMLHMSSTINTCSPWLNTKNTTLDTKKGRVLLNLLIMNAPTFVCPGLSSYTLTKGHCPVNHAPKGAWQCTLFFPGTTTIMSVWWFSLLPLCLPVSSALPSTRGDDNPGLDGLVTNPQNSGSVENFSRRRDAEWW